MGGKTRKPKGRVSEGDGLDECGLSAAARATLPADVQERVAGAWARGRALVLNAHKPSYSEAFTIEAEQYVLLRGAILEAARAFASPEGEVLLKDIVAFVQHRLETHPRFPTGRLTNYTRYTKVDLEARGELVRVVGAAPQRVRLSAAAPTRRGSPAA